MDEKRKMIIAAASGLLGLILIMVYISNLEKRYKVTEETMDVLVSTEMIPSRTLITLKNVTKISVPKKWAQPGALTPQDRLVSEQGQPQYAALLPINKGEQILSTKISLLGAETGLAFTIPEGKRAIAVNLKDDKGVGKLLKPGDYVDLVYGVDYTKTQKGLETQRNYKTLALFQNILVLAVNDELVLKKVEVDTKGKDKQSASRPSGGFNSGFVVTLAFDPAEATKFIFARDSGDLTLTLRSPGDKEIVKIPEIESKDIMKDKDEKKKDDGGEKKQEKEEGPSISIIRGTQEEKVTPFMPFPR